MLSNLGGFAGVSGMLLPTPPTRMTDEITSTSQQQVKQSNITRAFDLSLGNLARTLRTTRNGTTESSSFIVLNRSKFTLNIISENGYLIVEWGGMGWSWVG